MDKHALKTTLLSLPGLVVSSRQRNLLAQMRRFDQTLAECMRRPIPQAMADLTPLIGPDHPKQGEQRRVRWLGDVAMLLNGSSELGQCLRRSLIRYRFLRQAGLPVTINFGARMIAGQPDRAVTGHAWLTLNHAPYHETSENWRDFTVMFSYPEAAS